MNKHAYGKSRRRFLRNVALSGAGLSLRGLAASALEGKTMSDSRPAIAGQGAVKLSWLDGAPPATTVGVSWGVPWPRGVMPQGRRVAVRTADGRSIPTQNWPLAFWPDGSVKWTGLAIAAEPSLKGPLSLVAGAVPPEQSPMKVWEEVDGVEVNTGPMNCRIARSGPSLIESLTVEGREVARDGHLVVLREDRSNYANKRAVHEEEYTSKITKLTVEQSGPVQAVVRIDGVHAGGEPARTWLPFIVRFYFTAGTTCIRVVHSFVFDGDQATDFIRGLGIAFTVPFREEKQNRHVRFAGEGDGFWAEPVLMSPGYRPGVVKDAVEMNLTQLAGKRIPNLDQLDAKTKSQFETIAAWDTFKLTQLAPDSYAIAKRTNPSSSWLHVMSGTRAHGYAFIGDVSGGLAVGVKRFWEKYPSALEITGASTPAAELKVWFWSPDAAAMDLRHYDTIGHDGTISYEDWQPGFSTPYGVANTTDFTLWAMPSTPDDETLVATRKSSNQPPLLICEPEYYHATETLGIWSLPDRNTSVNAAVEDQLDRAWSFFANEVEQRRWYGFWDYGDFMRTYDGRRHQWMYDIGGHAWNNTELVPNMWLWFTFLRTGRPDAFRLAEAMTRNTSEVDVYHLGRFMGLGSRHNVSHWGCGAKEARISAALLKRYYYYLTCDERTGDLMREVLTVDETVMKVPPLREVLPRPIQPVLLRVGPDWLAFASNWMTEWERTGDTRYRDYVLAGMKSIGAMPEAFTTRLAFRYDPQTKQLSDVGDPNIPAGEFLDLFGGDQIFMELIQLIDCPEFATAWNLLCDKWARDSHAAGYTKMRITAYAANAAHDAALRQQTTQIMEAALTANGHDHWPAAIPKIEGPRVPRPFEEISPLTTIDTSQWAINLITTTELLRRFQPSTASRT